MHHWGKKTLYLIHLKMNKYIDINIINILIRRIFYAFQLISNKECYKIIFHFSIFVLHNFCMYALNLAFILLFLGRGGFVYLFLINFTYIYNWHGFFSFFNFTESLKSLKIYVDIFFVPFLFLFYC